MNCILIFVLLVHLIHLTLESVNIHIYFLLIRHTGRLVGINIPQHLVEILKHPEDIIMEVRVYLLTLEMEHPRCNSGQRKILHSHRNFLPKFIDVLIRPNKRVTRCLGIHFACCSDLHGSPVSTHIFTIKSESI